MVATNDISPFVMDRRYIQIQASKSMSGQLYKGLIELITNSITSYNALNSSIRDIYIDCERQTRTVRVYDRAAGLSRKDFEEKILRQGAENEEFMNNRENSPRGRFGMGIKDICALGSTKYESIKDGQYSILSMGDNFKPDATVHEDWVVGGIPKVVTRKATNDDFQNVLRKPKGSGTLITLQVKKSFPFPEKLSLMNQLSHHFELRRTLQIEGTDIKVRYDGGKPEKVRYFSPKRNLIYEKEIVIPGFQKIFVDGYEPKAKVTLYENENKESEVIRKQGIDGKEFREHGLFLTDGTETVFDNYLFKYDSSNYSALTNSFYGEIECAYINDLFRQRENQRDEDEGASNNNIWIITPNREGLDKKHPFIVSLAKVINPILEEFISSKNESEVGMSESFKSIASQMGRELRNELNKMFQEDEDDEEDDGHGDLDKPMSIIPGMAYLEVDGDSKVFTVKIRANELSPDAKLEVEFSDMEKIDLLKKSEFSQSDQDFCTAQIHIRAIAEFEEEIMEIRVGNLRGIATLSTDERRYRDDVIEEFKFEHETVTTRPNKNKNIRLYIPTEIYDAYIDSGEPKVSVRKPDIFYLDIKSKAIFKESVGAYQKTIGLNGKSLGSNDELTAVFGHKTAICRVSVTNNQRGRGGVRFKFDSNKDKAVWRGLVDRDDDGLICEIMTEHPVAKRILGADQEGQETIEGKTLLAEIIAGAWADYFIGNTSRVMGTPGDVVSERIKRMNTFLRITTKFLATNKIG